MPGCRTAAPPPAAALRPGCGVRARAFAPQGPRGPFAAMRPTMRPRTPHGERAACTSAASRRLSLAAVVAPPRYGPKSSVDEVTTDALICGVTYAVSYRWPAICRVSSSARSAVPGTRGIKYLPRGWIPTSPKRPCLQCATAASGGFAGARSLRPLA